MNDPFPTARHEYSRGGLSQDDAPASPLALFRSWYADAATLHEPNAMVLSTVSASGRPSSRTVLLKGLSEYGFVFYTNLTSRKAQDLAANPLCALVFSWLALERQVRVEGHAAEVSREQVAAYFATRPRAAQLGAWASRQSTVVPDRATLDARYAEMDARFPSEVPVPDFWGGYVVVPDALEFWQGREGRLHDRLRYTLTASGWQLQRLAP